MFEDRNLQFLYLSIHNYIRKYTIRYTDLEKVGIRRVSWIQRNCDTNQQGYMISGEVGEGEQEEQ